MQNNSLHKSLAALLAAGLTLVLAGCGGGGGSDGGGIAPISSVPTGSFGGTNIGLAVTAAGGTLQFPCGSSGTITSPLTLDATGHFSATGTVLPITGGAQPVGSTPKSYAATFTGTTDGKNVTLTITPDPAKNLSATTYTLASGAVPVFNAVCPQ